MDANALHRIKAGLEAVVIVALMSRGASKIMEQKREEWERREALMRRDHQHEPNDAN